MTAVTFSLVMAPRTKKQRVTRNVAAVVLITFLATSLATIILINLRAGQGHIASTIEHRFGVNDPQFVRAMGNLLGPPLVEGNEVKPLQNGDQIFPAMLEAIRGAQRSVTFETYIFWAGDIGRRFVDALCERARAKVKVHVIMDWLGSDRIDKQFLKDMKQAGVEFERYKPLRWYTLSHFNNRTHRKLLIVDGKTAFTGGVGIADPWLGNADRKDRWRESHFRLQGPAVAQMQAAFVDNWIKTGGPVLCGSDYFPELKPVGNSLAQVFTSSKTDGSANMRLMYLFSVTSAEKHVRLAASYFVPDPLAIKTFLAARERGVRIEIILAGPYTDAPAVRGASRSSWRDLLDAGVEIYEYQPARYHCKVMIVDDLWVSVGSANFDYRSFRRDDEANMNVYDGQFAAQLAAVFDEDKKNSRPVKKEGIKRRSALAKLVDELTATFSGQL